MDKQFFYNNFNFYYLDSDKNLLKKNIKSPKNKKLNISDLLSPKGVESTSIYKGKTPIGLYGDFIVVLASIIIGVILFLFEKIYLYRFVSSKIKW